MPDLKKQIEAVIFLLASFFGDPAENDRQASTMVEAAKNDSVKIYAGHTQKELKEVHNALLAGDFFY